jgi:hypothetical protein
MDRLHGDLQMMHALRIALFSISVVLLIGASNAAQAQWTTSGTNTTTTNNVGIGTTSPGQSLSVNGNIELKGNNNGTRWVVTDQDATGSTRLSFQAGAGSTGYGGALHLWGAGHSSKPGWVTIGLPNGAGSGSSEARFTVNNGGLADGVDVFTVLKTGNVGIGTTSPGSKLVVAAGAGTNYSGRFENSNSNRAVGIGVDATEAVAAIQAYAPSLGIGTGMILSLNPIGGNVGIGTTSPGYKLDVNGTVNATGLNINGSPITTSQWSNGTGNINYTSGKVGIGTSSPGDILHVSNAVRISPYSPNASGSYVNAGAVLRLLNGNIYQSGGSETSSIQFGGMYNPSGSQTDAYYNYIDWSAGWFRIRNNQQTKIQIGAGDEWGRQDIYFNPTGGNVGIGTTTPGYKLDVSGNTNVTGNLNITANGAGTGNIVAAGTINAKYQDVAEWVPASEQLSAGTVVVLDSTKSNQVISSSISYDTRVAGVVSEQPGIALGEKSEGKVLVATTGRVRVKVDATKAPIHIGDLLVTSDIPGFAMKSEPVNLGGVQLHRPGTLIGKAQESLEKGKGEILVLLSLQ